MTTRDRSRSRWPDVLTDEQVDALGAHHQGPDFAERTAAAGASYDNVMAYLMLERLAERLDGGQPFAHIYGHWLVRHGYRAQLRELISQYPHVQTRRGN